MRAWASHPKGLVANHISPCTLFVLCFRRRLQFSYFFSLHTSLSLTLYRSCFNISGQKFPLPFPIGIFNLFRPAPKTSQKPPQKPTINPPKTEPIAAPLRWPLLAWALAEIDPGGALKMVCMFSLNPWETPNPHRHPWPQGGVGISSYSTLCVHDALCFIHLNSFSFLSIKSWLATIYTSGRRPQLPWSPPPSIFLNPRHLEAATPAEVALGLNPSSAPPKPPF